MTAVNDIDKEEIRVKEPLISEDQYMMAGLHIGTKEKNKDMKPFIYRVRSDRLHIIDIRETDARIKRAAKFLSQYDPSKILVVSSREYGHYPAKRFVDLIGAQALLGRFIPGLMTNPALTDYREPEVIVINDPLGDIQGIKEAIQCGIPVVALCDTHNSTQFVDLAIPTNNKGKKALAMFYFLLTLEMLRLRGTPLALTPNDFVEADI